MRTDDERVAQLEKEIEQLRAEVRDKTASIAEEAAVLNAAIERGANSSVDDVHKAKQEAETRLSEVEAKLKDTESRLTELETQRQAADAKLVEAEERPKRQRPNGPRPNPPHLQRRLGTLEDQLEDARAQAEREDESARSRIAKAKEGEQAAWKEVGQGQDEELVEALREGAVTLEAARGDVEGLRAEVADLESLKTPGTQEGDGQPVEVVQLKRELEDIKKALEVAKKNEADLRATLEGLEKDKTEGLEQRAAEHQKTVSELQKKGTSAEQLRAESPNTRRDSVDSDSSRGPGKREQMLVSSTHIITGLEEEIRQWGSKYAMLEQENKLLESGTEQLQVVRDGELEATIDDKLDTKAEGTDGERIKRIETENELMKTKITEMEQKHARVVLDLNKEITELENLVESKIYREDDLERELERYKEKLARAQRPSGESMLTNGTSKSKSNIKVVTTMADRCELCESKDHDGMDCPLLHDGAAIGKDKKGWCADCEEFGHEVDECPNSQEVF
ncbi:CAP-Gly domain protein [Rhizoctonia solani]|uniref:CAP-Gly domain protein n=1 Tax=Rhizoctonia solani TaxID=456999 RepID=A0A8H8P066_9AGAM|nr:CAP-Gly domain protein [Rhizoctonia solani]QRW21287.1 CAP-Gly domain protein [Rhizoctonia solani]